MRRHPKRNKQLSHKNDVKTEPIEVIQQKSQYFSNFRPQIKEFKI